MKPPPDIWEKSSPEARYYQDVPPPASEASIRLWEAQHQVSLPSTLAQALLIQAWGYVRDTGNKLSFDSVDGFLPLSDDRWLHVEDEEGGELVADRSKQFVVGDYLGCAIVLDYNVGSEPRVLSIWHNLGDKLQDDEYGTFDEFLQAAWEEQREE